MESVVLDTIPFELDTGELLQTLRIKEGSEHVETVQRLAQEARAIARPKALYKPVSVEEKGDDWVVVDGVRLASRVLRVNLDKADQVFAYVATGGVELDAWVNAFDDEMLHQYWADWIAETALRSATAALDEHLETHYHLKHGSTMSPGSLPDWPLQEQRALFTILGNTRDSIGVQLTDSFLMLPKKTVSGVCFPTEEDFASCQLCPRDECRRRKAPFDPELFASKYREAG